MFDNCNRFECGYINKPYCNLRPITSITPCPRFSCPPPNCFDCPPNCCVPDCFDCPPCNCSPNFPCPPQQCNCQPCINPNLIWFLGGFIFGRNSNRFSGNEEFQSLVYLKQSLVLVQRSNSSFPPKLFLFELQLLLRKKQPYILKSFLSGFLQNCSACSQLPHILF